MYFGDWLGDVAGDWWGDADEETQAGLTSLLAFWLGGAAAGIVAATQAGLSSLLAFWAGGAAAEAAATTPVGHGKVRRRKRGKYEVDAFTDWEREKRPDDEEWLLMTHMR